MKATIFSLLCFTVFGISAEPKKLPQPPPDFLRTNNPGWKRILAKEVSANFQETPIRDALQFIVFKGDANFTTRFGDKPHPMITRNIKNVPFRMALFLLAQDAGARVILEMEGGFPRGIVFTTE
jgi:hypothetical protein